MCCLPSGVYLFNVFLRKVQLRRLFFGLAMAGVAAGFTQLVLVTGEPQPEASCCFQGMICFHLFLLSTLRIQETVV